MIIYCVKCGNTTGNNPEGRERKTSLDKVVKEGLLEKITVKWRPIGWDDSVLWRTEEGVFQVEGILNKKALR